MTEFEKLSTDFRNQRMEVFNDNPAGLLWLKVRAISRDKHLKQFTKGNGIVLRSSKVSEKNAELFDILSKREDANCMLDRFLQNMNHEWYAEMGVDIEQLKEDLYQIKSYSWGGDQNNSLDKYFISRYVKVISNYGELMSHKSDIGANAWNYVQNSWYNNWTSFIIESLFKRNPKVISAVGEIKSVDFFMDNYPLDLKVTFFPQEYMEQKIRLKLGKNSLSWLKAKSKKLGITCDTHAAPSQQYYTLIEKLKELNATDIIGELDNTRRNIINEAQSNPAELMKWLYENQGEMRFGAENRIFLILADSTDMTESWKMKRAFSLIEPIIHDYIENFTSQALKPVRFNYKQKSYTALSDIIFVVK